jgi:hypothetical protein
MPPLGMNSYQQRAKRACDQESKDRGAEDEKIDLEIMSRRDRSISEQEPRHESPQKCVSNPSANLQFPKEGRLKALRHMIAQMFINHC